MPDKRNDSIVAILCRRDGCTIAEATQRIEEAKQAIKDSRYDTDCIDDIMMEFLGLEPDYLMDLLEGE